MQIEKYKTESTVSSLVFTFESVGEKIINKRVIYSKFKNPEDIGLPLNANVYNLGFGDFNEQTGQLDDQIISKNGDTEQVLATVAGTVSDFWIEYPDAQIFFMGSIPEGEKPRRTRLYQMKINRYFADISLIVNVRGFTENGWETFSKDKNYIAFLILQKTKYFSIMKTQESITKNGYAFKRSTYNPALDYLEGQVFFKEKMDRARAFLKEHGLPKDIVDELNRKANLEKNTL